MTDHESRDLAVVHDFLTRYASDQESGLEPSLARYQELFPGHEELIAREFAAVTSAAGDDDDEGVPTAFLADRQLGPYRLLELLGHGGQGVVYLAEDTRLGRRVALKLLSSRRVLTPAQLTRFRREAETASRFDHPGICTVFEAGELEGAPFLAMQLIDGENLSTFIRREAAKASDSGSESRQRRLFEWVEIVERVARAAHVAHEAGVVHRDLKPANVMIAADGRPVILDFGLAQDDASDEALTLTGDLLGTPAYLAPERIRGGARVDDARLDVYGLGATLYECLTGEPPFAAPTRDQLCRAIVTDPVPDARRLEPRIPPDLQVVLEVALEKDPDRRYRTALDLADDLARVRRREPIRARPLPATLLVRRWVQRHPALSASAAAIFGLLSAGLAVALTLLASRDAALATSRALGLAGESRRIEDHDATLSLLLAREAENTKSSAVTVSQLYRATGRARQIAEFWHRRETADVPVTTLWTPDRQRLVTVSGLEGKSQIRRRDGELVAEVAHGEFSKSAAMHPSGELFATAGGDEKVCLWDLEGKPVGELRHDAEVYVRRFMARSEALVRFSPDDGRYVLTGTLAGRVSVWDVASRNRLWRSEPAGDGVSCLAWSPAGDRFVVGFADGSVRVWPFEASRVSDSPKRLEGHGGAILAIAFSPSGKGLLATASGDGTARLWNVHGACLATMAGHGVRATDVAFAPDGERIATTDMRGYLRLWRTGENRPLRELRAHHEVAMHARFSPDGRFLVITSAEGPVHVFDGDGRSLFRLAGHGASLSDICFLDQQTVCTTGWNGSVRLWSLVSEDFAVHGHDDPLTAIAVGAGGRVAVAGQRRVFLGDLERPFRQEVPSSQELRIWSVAFAPDGTRVATAAHDGKVSVWDPLTGRPLWCKPVTEWHSYSVVFAKDGRLAVGNGNGVSFLEPDGRLSTTLPSFPGEIYGLALSADGTRLAAACMDKKVYVLEGREVVHQLEGHERPAWSVAFSPDGELLASTSFDGTARLWSLADGACVATMTGHRSRLNSVSFSPDGDHLVTSSHDRTAKIWRRDGSLHATLTGHEGPVLGAVYTPDGERILTVGLDGTFRSWPAKLERLRELADKRAFREFTEEERMTYAELLGPKR